MHDEYRPLSPADQRDALLVCCKCRHPLADNLLVKRAWRMNTVNGWAKTQLRIIAEMLEDRGEVWFANSISKIADNIELLKTEADNDEKNTPLA